MLKYRYLPFTHSKPRYQGLIEQKWQLNAQLLPTSETPNDTAAPPPVAAATLTTV